MLFCLAFTVIRPLAVIAWIMPKLRPTSFLTYLILAEIAFGMIVGVLLWMQREEALPSLRVFLAFAVTFNVIRLLVFVITNHDPTASAGAVRYVWGVVVLLLWFSYFRNSRRVRNTYGRNL